MKFIVGLRRTVIVVLAAFFLLSVPFAGWYARTFDPGAPVVRTEADDPVVIRVAAVGCGRHIAAFRAAGVKYTKEYRNVKFFILALTDTQVAGQAFEIVIRVGVDEMLEAAMAAEGVAREHCQNFLRVLSSEFKIMVV